ncbi:hypothetical protein AB0M35_27960 [Micromonospora sp. NPDC051196]|uniref:hypothetical protein n=1 Tax=Micromonospora sp. NPDC051196 TaxID=3155281 RepID=UPI00341CE363
MTLPAEGGQSPGDRDKLGTMLGVAGVVLAVVVMLFKPALPYEVNSAFEMLLLLCSSAALIWLIFLCLRWWQQHQRPHGFRRATALAAVFGSLLAMTAMQIEETGVRSAHCEFGVHGLGLGMVWAKVEPREPGKKYQFTARWGPWVGRPKPVVLHQKTYFTFLKRDIYSSETVDVMVDRDAKITCGDGRPPSDEDQIHLNGADWINNSKPAPQVVQGR